MRRLGLAVTCVLLLVACGSYDSIDREDLLTNAKTKVQTQNGIWIYTNMNFEEEELQEIMLDLDTRLEDFVDCMAGIFGIDVDISPLTHTVFPVILVPEAFDCFFDDHEWCGGEHHSNPPFMILAEDTPDGGNFKFWEVELCHDFVGREECQDYRECI